MNLRPMLLGAALAVLAASPACQKNEPVTPGTAPAPGASGAPQAGEPAPAAQPSGDAGAAQPSGETGAAQPSGAGGEAGAAPAAAAPTGNPESTDILGREPVTDKAKVKHVLISWKDLAPAFRGTQDPRGAQRTRAEADALAAQVLERVRKGEDIDALMAELSEDPGSARTGRAYDVTADAPLVPPFKKLSLRLEVNEAGLVLTDYGWHIIKRVE